MKSKKLSLKKIKISELSDSQSSVIVGGYMPPPPNTGVPRARRPPAGDPRKHDKTLPKSTECPSDERYTVNCQTRGEKCDEQDWHNNTNRQSGNYGTTYCGATGLTATGYKCYYGT